MATDASSSTEDVEESNNTDLRQVTRDRLAREARQWSRPLQKRDITAEFGTAARKLPVGELVKDEHFTLFEAVGALEIMDPKMDSGYVPPNDTFEPNFDVCASLLPTEILWIMDEIMRLEMNFHDGYPLSQNIFTSLHIFQLISPDNQHPPSFGVNGRRFSASDDRLVDVVLRAFCIAVIKTCELTLRDILANTFFEDEDFVTFLFGRELLPKISLVDANKILLDARDWLLEGAEVDQQVRNALQHRLEFRTTLLQAMQTPSGDSLWVDLKTQAQQELHKHHAVAKSVPQAFSDKVQRQLATSTPPRPMPHLSFEAAWTKWAQLCNDLLFAITSVSSSHDSPCGLFRATIVFAYRQPPPSVLARAKMQNLVLGNDKVMDTTSHFELLLNDMRELVLAGDALADPASFEIELPTDPRHRCARVLEDFMQKAIGPYLNILCATLQNRSRFRRLTLQSISQWDRLEHEARLADNYLNDICSIGGAGQGLGLLGLWTRFHHLNAVQLGFQLGLELDVAQHHELALFYLNLSYIARTKWEDLTTMESIIAERSNQLMRSQRAYQVECLFSRDLICSLILVESINQGIAGALAELYRLLESINVMDARLRPFADPQCQFEARNKPFLGWENLYVADATHVEYQRRATASTSIGSIARSIISQLDSVKLPLQTLKKMTPEQAKCTGTETRWRQELHDLEKVCVATRVTMSQLLRICHAHGKGDRAGSDLSDFVSVQFAETGKRYHDWWIVPQINEKR